MTYKTYEFIWPLSWGDWIESCSRYTGIREGKLEDMIVEEVEVSTYDLGVTLNVQRAQTELWQIVEWADDNALDTGYTT